MHDLGYASFVIDHRGQGLSSRLTDHPMKGHVEDFSEFVEDFEAFAQEVRSRTPKGTPVHLLSHSMGGTIALLWLLHTKNLPQSAIFFAPFWGIRRQIARPGVRSLTRIISTLGGKKRFMPGDYQEYRIEPFRINRVTCCKKRHLRNQRYLADNKKLALGDISWGWLEAAFRAIKAIEKADLSMLTLPIGIFGATEELLVDNGAIERVASVLPNAQLDWIQGAKHEILMETDKVQEIVWPKIAEFLQKADQE